MMQNLTIGINNSLFNAAQHYATQHNTTISQIVQGYLAQVTGVKPSQAEIKILERFSQSEITRLEAMKALDIDYSTLLDKLGECGLSLPSLPAEALQPMVDNFVRIMKEAEEQ
jgi:hypothetical protein